MPRPTRPPSRQNRPPRLHPRNRHPGRYDFAKLTRLAPELAGFMRPGVHGQPTLDFANPDAVRSLNRALLLADYGVQQWDIPPGYLCPPIPGRADYIHHLADLLGQSHDGVIPAGSDLVGLDVGTGANLVYPLVGHAEYGWRFIGCDIDSVALANARSIIQENPALSQAIELRRQADTQAIFDGVIQPGEKIDFTLCNPPFHANEQEARDASRRKWQHLRPSAAAELNFGGQHNELYCADGEIGFLNRTAEQSTRYATQVFWFSALVSKGENVAPLKQHLIRLGATDVREIAMAQGNRRSRFVAWTYLDKNQRRAWRRERWPAG